MRGQQARIELSPLLSPPLVSQPRYWILEGGRKGGQQAGSASAPF